TAISSARASVDDDSVCGGVLAGGGKFVLSVSAECADRLGNLVGGRTAVFLLEQERPESRRDAERTRLEKNRPTNAAGRARCGANRPIPEKGAEEKNELPEDGSTDGVYRVGQAARRGEIQFGGERSERPGARRVAGADGGAGAFGAGRVRLSAIARAAGGALSSVA